MSCAIPRPFDVAADEARIAQDDHGVNSHDMRFRGARIEGAFTAPFSDLCATTRVNLFTEPYRGECFARERGWQASRLLQMLITLMTPVWIRRQYHAMQHEHSCYFTSAACLLKGNNRVPTICRY